MRYSDRPISLPQDDALGRAPFSLALANAIDNLAVANDGFVIGLIGEWGSGKSSVAELTIRYLRHVDMIRACGEDEDVPSIFDLEAMADAFSRVEHLIDDFLERNLDVQLWNKHHRDRQFRIQCGSTEDTELALRYWDLLRRLEEKPRNIVVRFSPWLFPGKAELASALLSDLARVVGEKLGDDVRKAFASVLNRLSNVVPIVGAATDVVAQAGLGGLFSAGVDVSNRLAKRMTDGPTVESVRARLRKKLGRSNRTKILVVVDDLDRLTPDEAVEMVSLLKGLGDLPNVVYLLCYDEVRLGSLISTSFNVDGHEYLQKIVQYPIHLPPLEPPEILNLLNADLESLVTNWSTVATRRLNIAWFLTLSRYIGTPRDVRRLMNSFSVALSGVGSHTDPVDLLLLETLRIHEPAVYHWLRRNYNDLAV
ncbi:hypothetical protein B5M44_10590 [Shinella sumterensis]|uniref:KAP family P-loop NTPase fold protein n=1 Tax=Shinella sumterensis TaxID=1967501 RepID=UPI00106DEDBB|nr:P-loop NTPase fold protein [Shinella sumterensis]MCD1264575.1 hypothetical protein [Shinella sumterensis]TFE98470.1 hypothetical protein B5M44_10590 [Shinella sumterensis]